MKSNKGCQFFPFLFHLLHEKKKKNLPRAADPSTPTRTLGQSSLDSSQSLLHPSERSGAASLAAAPLAAAEEAATAATFSAARVADEAEAEADAASSSAAAAEAGAEAAEIAATAEPGGAEGEA